MNSTQWNERLWRTALWLTVAVVILFRFFFFVYGLRHVPVSSDESWPSLMAMHMLHGEFPIVYWGQTYMGTQESFVQAGLIALFGPHTAVVRLYPFAFGFLFVWFSYLLASRIYNREVGLLTLLLLAVPVPYLTICSVIISPDNYLAMTALGSLALVVAHRLIYAEPPPSRPAWLFAALGLLLGFTFWLHILVVSYIGVALLFLFLKDKLFFLRKPFWAFLAAAVLGSLPLVVYNIRHHMATFSDVGQTATWHRAWELLQVLFIKTLHFLVGMKVVFAGDSPFSVSLPHLSATILGLLWILLVVWVIVARFKSFLPLLRLSLKGTDGTVMLLVMAAAAIYVFCRSIRSSSVNVRYVLPIISVLPVLGAYGLWLVGRRSRLLGGLLLAFILGMQAWGNVVLARGWSDPRVIDEELHLPDTRGLRAFLEQNGIRHAYAHFWVSYRLTFESKEQLICSEPFNIRFPMRAKDVKFMDQVQAAGPVAYISERLMGVARGISSAKMEALLNTIGGSYKKQVVDHFTVFYDFKPPYGSGVLQQIPSAGWSARSETNPADAAKVFDGNPQTRWSAGSTHAGATLNIDMGVTQTVCKVGFDLAEWILEAPRGYRVSVSLDGRQWQDVYDTTENGGGLFWEGSHPRFLVYGDYYTAAFAPVSARYIRFTLTKSHPKYDWSIAELRLFTPAGETASKPGS